ncbi:TPA: hypothetical protein OOF39_000410 [Kluyvera ascorbata]|nr:hypothetical protein [Kluyvera ascorbata]
MTSGIGFVRHATSDVHLQSGMTNKDLLSKKRIFHGINLLHFGEFCMGTAPYHNASEHWLPLLNLIGDKPLLRTDPKQYCWGEHRDARAIARFLAHATLATPALDRATITDLLNGTFAWPRNDGMQHVITTVYPLSFFEDAGLLSFYGGWCVVHCRAPQTTEGLDESICDLLAVTQQLREITLGLNGYIRPHYHCSATDFSAQIREEFGSLTVSDLLTGAICENGMLKLFPDSLHFTPLHSTYLWQYLADTLPVKEAFACWIQRARVLGETVVPVILPLPDAVQNRAFQDEVLALFSVDPAMGYTLRTLHRQIVNDAAFDRIIRPQTLCVDIASSGTTVSRKDVPGSPVTVQTLGESYSHFPGADLHDPHVLTGWQRRGERQRLLNPLVWLLHVCLHEAVQVESRSLSASYFAVQLYSLTKTHPVLQFLLWYLLPASYGGKYSLYLLADDNTCDVGLFHLTHRDLLLYTFPAGLSGSGMDRVYQELLVAEYLRAKQQDTSPETSLLQTLLFLAGDLTYGNESRQDGFSYRLLTCLCSALNDGIVVALAKTFLAIPLSSWGHDQSKSQVRSLWYIGFWLAKRLESAGVTSENPGERLRDFLFDCYQDAFVASLRGENCDLVPDTFWASLPWTMLIKDNVLRPLLKISGAFHQWEGALTFNGDNSMSSFRAASAVRQYLQLLFSLAGHYRGREESEPVQRRILDIVCTHGFGTADHRQYVFNSFMPDQVGTLWQTFCRFLTTVPEGRYEEFFDRCIDQLPLDFLYILLEFTSSPKRSQDLQEAILSRQPSEMSELAPDALETAFVSACHQGHIVLAAGLLEKASPYIERFRTLNHPDFELKWKAYRYRYTLLVMSASSPDPVQFEHQANALFPPEEGPGRHQQWFRRECDHFRRYIIASAYCEQEPARSVVMMEALWAETQEPHHAFLLFQARIAVSEKQNTSAMCYALDKFMGATQHVQISKMNRQWVTLMLETMRCVSDRTRAENLWRQLAVDQKQTVSILIPYCRLLISQGEAWHAQRILADAGIVNLSSDEASACGILLDELNQALPGMLTFSDLISAVNAANQRTISQLSVDYAQIVSSPFADYVSIVRKKCTPDVYLKDIIVEIAHELLLRKKNLSIQSVSKKSGRLVHEDLINDWFTSLFDKRMAEARIGFRDQKRGGQSASGETPGEVDGFITDSKNVRIAIFEAFRLSGLIKSVIGPHLDKIAGYDGEALPVFIVAYCDVGNFNRLTRSYGKYIDGYDYTGYVKLPDEHVSVLQDTDRLWLGQESRYRGTHRVVFYHLLLNLR